MCSAIGYRARIENIDVSKRCLGSCHPSWGRDVVLPRWRIPAIPRTHRGSIGPIASISTRAGWVPANWYCMDEPIQSRGYERNSTWLPRQDLRTWRGRTAICLSVVHCLLPGTDGHTALLHGDTACAVLLLALTIASVLVSIRALNLKLSARGKILATVLVLGSWPVALGLYERQLSLVVAFLLAVAGMEITRGRLMVAGLCLACAMIKPQLSLPLSAWLLVWVTGNWQERKSLFLSFIATTSVLLLGAELALPHWFANWWHSLPAYMSYTGSKPSLQTIRLRPGICSGPAADCGCRDDVLEATKISGAIGAFWICVLLGAFDHADPDSDFFACIVQRSTADPLGFYGSVPHGRTPPPFHASASWCGYWQRWH
jgi:hypothetical protein